MNETEFISDSAARNAGNAGNAFRVMSDTPSGLASGKMPKQ
jgi:hypothetical protein